MDSTHFWLLLPKHSGRPNLPHATTHTPAPASICLFEGNETGRVGGTDTGTTVLDGLAVWLLVIYSSFFLQPVERGLWGGTYYEMENSAR